MADAVDPGAADVVHVSRVPDLSLDAVGRSDAPDDDVARWCAANGVVLVTCDGDFRGRTARTSALTRHDVEVIVFTYQVRGLQNQIATIVRRVPL